MPTYDYRCNGCGHTFEHFQGLSEPLLTKCPECRRKKLERLIGAGAGLIFKGSGFYITDYRPDAYAAAAKQDAAPSSDAKPAADGKSKSAPEAAGDRKPTDAAKVDAKPPASAAPKPKPKDGPVAPPTSAAKAGQPARPGAARRK